MHCVGMPPLPMGVTSLVASLTVKATGKGRCCEGVGGRQCALIGLPPLRPELSSTEPTPLSPRACPTTGTHTTVAIAVPSQGECLYVQRSLATEPGHGPARHDVVFTRVPDPCALPSRPDAVETQGRSGGSSEVSRAAAGRVAGEVPVARASAAPPVAAEGEGDGVAVKSEQVHNRSGGEAGEAGEAGAASVSGAPAAAATPSESPLLNGSASARPPPASSNSATWRVNKQAIRARPHAFAHK